jgi:hypothetical protein
MDPVAVVLALKVDVIAGAALIESVGGGVADATAPDQTSPLVARASATAPIIDFERSDLREVDFMQELLLRSVQANSAAPRGGRSYSYVP